jgi:hypothetical protein
MTISTIAGTPSSQAMKYLSMSLFLICAAEDCAFRAMRQTAHHRKAAIFAAAL